MRRSHRLYANDSRCPVTSPIPTSNPIPSAVSSSTFPSEHHRTSSHHKSHLKLEYQRKKDIGNEEGGETRRVVQKTHRSKMTTACGLRSAMTLGWTVWRYTALVAMIAPGVRGMRTRGRAGGWKEQREERQENVEKWVLRRGYITLGVIFVSVSRNELASNPPELLRRHSPFSSSPPAHTPLCGCACFIHSSCSLG